MSKDDGDQTFEISNEPEFLDFWKRLPGKPATTFRLFERTGYHTTHGIDAEFIAKEILKTETLIKYLGGDKVPYLTLGRAKFDAVVRNLLIHLRYRIEIYKQDEKSKSNWILSINSSPGNLNELEEIIYSSQEFVDIQGLAAIRIHVDDEVHIGFAFVDSLTNRISFAQFNDNVHLTHLEALLISLSPKECLGIIGKSDINERFNEILLKANIIFTEGKHKDFNNKDTLDSLKIISKNNDCILGSLRDKELAMGSLNAVINYLNLLGQKNNEYILTEIQLGEFMRLDSFAMRSLELFPIVNEHGSTKTLFSLLNKCRTQIGQRLLAQYIRQPLTDIKKIEERLNIVECFINDNKLRNRLYDNHLRQVPDLTQLARKFQQKRATLTDCVKVYYFLKCVPRLIEDLEESECLEIKGIIVKDIKAADNCFMNFRDLIESTVDFDNSDLRTGEVLINYEIDDHLKETGEQLNEIKKKAEKIFRRVARDLGMEDKGLKMDVNNHTGYHLKVSRNNEKIIRSQREFTPVEQTKKDGVRFVNAALEDINEDYVPLKRSFDDMQNGLVVEILNTAATYSGQMRSIGNLLGQLDVYVALACASISAPIQYVRPKLLPQGSGKIDLIQVRHPCLECQVITTSFIPNDVHFDAENHKFFIITGPNMGGKSTFIRSVALNVLLAQIGCFVPAQKATISVIDGLYSRVGAGDTQLYGISTFMSEMVEVSSILRTLTDNSLVIIDELGRGTSTYDGFGIAYAVSEHLAKNINCYCLFATHFHELTELSDIIPSVGNLNVAAQTTSDNLTMLYSVCEGICDQSFGIHVANMVEFPARVIDSAKEKVKQFQGFKNMTKSEFKEVLDYYTSIIKDLDVDNLSDEELMLKTKEIKANLLNNFPKLTS